MLVSGYSRVVQCAKFPVQNKATQSDIFLIKQEYSDDQGK